MESLVRCRTEDIDWRALLNYDPETGAFRWAVYLGTNACIGARAGHTRTDGYVIITYRGQTHLAHRIAFVSMGMPVPRFVDHRNRVKDDNRWCNLRPASFAQNMTNRDGAKNTITGYKGVSSNGRNFAARIRVNGKQIYLGTFTTPEKAYAAYTIAAKKYHGEFARTV